MSPYAATGDVRIARVRRRLRGRLEHASSGRRRRRPGRAVAISVRVGDSATPDAGWTAWQPIAAPGSLSLNSRYIQYQAVLTTSDVNVTPSLDDIIISTGHAPVAADDSIVVPENGVTTLPASGAGSLTANDTDDDGDVLEVIAAGPASHGIGGGPVRRLGALHADANYNGPDSFVYTVSDGVMTSSAIVTVDVRFGNIAPVAVNDFYTMNEDTALSVPAATGLLKNDTDVEHDVLAVVLTSLPAHGQLTINSLGSFTYTPTANYAGPDAFTYKAFDGQAYSEPATVTDQHPAGERSAGQRAGRLHGRHEPDADGCGARVC